MLTVNLYRSEESSLPPSPDCELCRLGTPISETVDEQSFKEELAALNENETDPGPHSSSSAKSSKGKGRRRSRATKIVSTG